MKRSNLLPDAARLIAAVLLLWLYQPELYASETDAVSEEDGTAQTVPPESTPPAAVAAEPAVVTPADLSPPETTAETRAAPKRPPGIADLVDMFNAQQKQLDEQNRQLVMQSAQIKDQQALIATLIASQDKSAREYDKSMQTINTQAEEIDAQRKSLQTTLAQVDEISQKKAQELSAQDVALRARLETLESSIQTSRDAANTAFDEDSFPNSISIPGTNAAMKFGGFVKLNIVDTFGPLDSLDRFIAGTIPVPQESQSPRTTMTVSQSRLNWDLRERTEMGVMRAYVEGDFAGEGDTFRLRHAFGQFRNLLAGKTWSSFMDPDASPEELDFEGINGRVNVRQAQLRYFPTIGGDWNVIIALEEPQAEVTGGDAISQWPDLLLSARRAWFKRWHIKSSVVVRQLTATWDFDTSGNTKSKETAYGISISGNTQTQFWNDLGLNDFMFQFNVGKGIGHYINDLDTIDGQDAVFDSNGNLETLPVFAGYVAYQHWWNERMRSTFNFSWVKINNLDFQPPDAYQGTLRTALNFIWSPVPRIDIGAEIIWGERKNNNDEKADASQIQLSTKYRF